MKIIVAHSGKQYSFQTANALNKYGRLYKYLTTVYDKPFSLTRLLISVLRGKNKRKALSRKNPNLKDNQVKSIYEQYTKFTYKVKSKCETPLKLIKVHKIKS
jgi:hypothetical protein